MKVQEAKAGDMIHNMWELIEYGSSIITLFPGDVINSGTTGGTSSGAFKRGTRAGYLKPGETIEATSKASARCVTRSSPASRYRLTCPARNCRPSAPTRQPDRHRLHGRSSRHP